ncbi:hypothetical protein L1264_20875 [Pseudoalteromonas sp. APAL1]|uniref:hypothetical protein n=1 Tax=Pseudoalteromonas TaxID=53246 RepID=UPI0018F524D8|nr:MULTISPECIES: hypothetical protein [unclassified Pseudoalteromonas]MCF2922917.1 hypothetical protein [Pseudoalteromonas sp. APAL1]
MYKDYLEGCYKGLKRKSIESESLTNERESYFCKEQSKMPIFPKEQCVMNAWSDFQLESDRLNRNGESIRAYNTIAKDNTHLKLGIGGTPTNWKTSLIVAWIYIHLSVIFLLISMPLLAWLLGNEKLSFDLIIICFLVWLISKLVSIFLRKSRLFKKLKLQTFFNRSSGNIEVPSSDGKELIGLKYDEFNAHYRVVHNPNSGFPFRGFTLLHYKKDELFDYTGPTYIYDVFCELELIENFMDTTKPLADIPQFEYYREFDKTTAEFDKANCRPKYFWYRVERKFAKQMNKEALKLSKEFDNEEQLDNLLMGKPIKKLNPPEIFKFPWKYAENIKPESEIKFGKTAWQKFTSFLMIDL